MKLLIITDDPAAETKLHAPLEKIADGGELEVKVVAPIRPASTLDLLSGEIDDAAAGAQQRAEESAARSADSDAVTSTETEVGDADQLTAIGDALAQFDAEHVVLVDPDEDDLADEVRERYKLPVTVLSES